MKLLINRTALGRVQAELAVYGPRLEILAVDPNGIWHGNEKVEPQAASPETVWLSFDAYAEKTLPVFFQAALSSNSTKWVQTFNAGLDLPIFKTIMEKGIRLSNSDAQAVPIAEYVMGYALSELLPIAKHREAQAAKTWRMAPFREISQTNWLIVGYGHIGMEIARRAKAFGAHVTGVKRNAGAQEFADKMVTNAELLRALPNADVVVLACSLNDSTRDLANEAFFRAMKPGSLLINIARGGVVVDEALMAALDRDAPAVAVLDVFREEPLPAASPYWTHPKVRVTAHTSATGGGIMGRGDKLFLGNLKRYLAGERLINEVDPKAV